MGRKCFLITLFFSAVSASVGGGRMEYASRRRDGERKGGEKKKGNEGGQRPQSQIKALSLPSASAFRSPCQDREASHVTAVSQCHRSERERTSKERERDREREGQTETQRKRKRDNATDWAGLGFRSWTRKEKKNQKNSSSRLNRMRKPLWFVMLMQHRFSVQCKSISKSLICALTFSRQIISKCSVNAASQIISSMPPGTNWTLTIS